jgi:hypothetical protein
MLKAKVLTEHCSGSGIRTRKGKLIEFYDGEHFTPLKFKARLSSTA